MFEENHLGVFYLTKHVTFKYLQILPVDSFSNFLNGSCA